MGKPKSIFYFDKNLMSTTQNREAQKLLKPLVKSGACIMVPADGIAKHFGIKQTKPVSKSDYTPEFEEVWGQWGKGRKRNGAQAYHSAISRGYTHTQISAGLPTLIKEENKRQASDGKNYRPIHLSTWLNGDGFLNVQVDNGGAQEQPQSQADQTISRICDMLQCDMAPVNVTAIRECISSGVTLETIQENISQYDRAGSPLEFLYSIS